MDKPKLYLSEHCPKFGTLPVHADGSFDHEKMGKLLQMQEGEGATLDEYVSVMQTTVMEDAPLVRARESILAGVEVDGMECHPETWEKMPEDYRAMFELVNPPTSQPSSDSECAPQA